MRAHGLELLEASGHDVMTVAERGLRGVTDEELFEICSTEGRTLITLVSAGLIQLFNLFFQTDIRLFS
jgi:hypothetical protein